MRKLLAGFFLICAGSAWAQSGELWFSAGSSLLSNTGLGTTSPTGSPNDFKLDNGFKFAFRFGFNTSDYLGHEIQYAYSRSHLISGGVNTGGMAIHQGGYNFLGYAMKSGSRIRPFGTVGLQFANYVPPGSSASYGQGSTKFGFNYGGGVKVRTTEHIALRFDVRRYDTPKPEFGLLQRNGWLHQTEVSAGVGYVF
jgi:opacity protein-like surface antigen